MGDWVAEVIFITLFFFYLAISYISGVGYHHSFAVDIDLYICQHIITFTLHLPLCATSAYAVLAVDATCHLVLSCSQCMMSRCQQCH